MFLCPRQSQPPLPPSPFIKINTHQADLPTNLHITLITQRHLHLYTTH